MPKLVARLILPLIALPLYGLAQTQGLGNTIEPGLRVRTRIEPKQTIEYSINVKEGNYVHLVAEQIGANIALSMSESGEQLGAMDRWGDPEGEESLSAVAPKTGLIVISISSKDNNRGGEFALSVFKASAPTQPDSFRIEAERLYVRAGKLVARRDERGLLDANSTLIRCLELWRKVGDPLWIASSEMWLGVNEYQLGDLQAAKSFYELSLISWKAAGDLAGEAATMSDLGRVYDSLGQSDRALQLYRISYRGLAPFHDYQWEAHILHNIGMAQLNLGNTSKALVDFRKSYAISVTHNDRFGKEHVLHHIGEVELLLAERLQGKGRGRMLRSASADLDLSLQESRELKDSLGEATTLNHLGIASLAAQRYSAAETYFEKAKQIRHSAGYKLGEAQSACEIGESKRRLGLFPDSLSEYSTCEQIAVKAPDPRRQVEALLGQARVWRDITMASGDLSGWRECVAKIDEGLDVLDKLRMGVVDLDLRVSYFSSVHRYYESAEDITNDMPSSDPHRASRAIMISERARSRELQDNLRAATERAAATSQAANRITLEDLERGIQQKQLAYEHPADESEAGAGSSPLSKASNAEEPTAPSENTPTDSLLHASGDRAPPTLRELRNSTGTEVAILEYFVGDRHSYVWLETREGVRAFRLPGRLAIRAFVRNYMDRLQTCSGAKWDLPNGCRTELLEAAQVLSNVIIPRASISRLREHTLLIVADDLLESIPFAALPAGSALLVDRFDIQYAPSLSVLFEAKRRSHTNRLAQPTILFLANTAEMPRRTSTGTTSALVGRKPLWLSADTRFALESTLGARAIVQMDGAGASHALSSSRLRAFRVIHFQVHGTADMTRPERSGLWLSQSYDARRIETPLLNLRRISQLRLNGQIVFLAACQTATGPYIIGEGVDGVAQSFLSAGASVVVGTIWDVEETATSQIVALFYQELNKPGTSVNEALSRVQRRFAHLEPPYYWAGLKVLGDGTQTYLYQRDPVSKTKYSDSDKARD